MSSRWKHGNKHGRPDYHPSLCPVDGCTSKVQKRLWNHFERYHPEKKGEERHRLIKSMKIVRWKPVIGRKLTTIKRLSPNKKKPYRRKTRACMLLLKLLATLTRLTLIPHQKEPQEAMQILTSMKTNRSNFQGVVGELRGRGLCCTTSTLYRHWRFKTSKVL